MASFTDAISEILPLLAEPAPLLDSRIGREFPQGTFAAVALVLLERLCDPKTTATAIDGLNESGLLDAPSLSEFSASDLKDNLAEAGVRLGLKESQLLVKLAQWFASADLESNVEATNTEALRDGLRAIRGIGPATGDALLLDGFGRAAYPVDRSTYRILVRHNWIDDTAEYDEARAVVESAASADPLSLRLISQGFESIGRRFCKVSGPKCERCPLRPFLPENGPVDPSG